MISPADKAAREAARAAMALTIKQAPDHSRFKCERCGRVYFARALRVLALLRCRSCHREVFIPITEDEAEELARGI
jgi:hypothetical protein